MQPQASDHNVSEFRKFIQSNSQYLKTKFNGFFSKQDKQIYTIMSVPQQTIVVFVNQVFSLQSYNHNAQVKKVIQNGLKSNIQQYKFEKISQQKKQDKFNYERAVQVLIYIIENNSMFAVQYESAQNDQKDQNNLNSNLNLKVGVNLSQIEQLYDNSYGNSKQKNIHRNLQNQNDFTNQNHQLRNSFVSNQNQFYINQENLNNLNQNLVKKNAKIVFQFYCRQQMQLPNLSTFDYIKNQTQSMSLGKCLTFAKATQLYNVFIKKETLVSKFKKLSQGKKSIDFQKFYCLLSNLQVLDPQINNRLGLYSEDPHKLLKYVKLPFNTKDTSPRQIIANRNFYNKLTQHSGKTSQNLKQEIQNQKMILKNICRINNMKSAIQAKNIESQLITPKDLNQIFSRKKRSGKDFTVDLSFISSIVHPQEADKTWLKQHQISSLAKKNSSELKQKRLQTERYKSVDKLTIRKQYIVQDIRKRIKQIQSVQRIDYNKLRSKIKLPKTTMESKSKQKQKQSFLSQNLRYFVGKD